MRIPADASPAVRQAFKEIHERLQTIGASHAPNVNLQGQRVTNAGEAEEDADYITRGQVMDLLTLTLAATQFAITPPSTTGAPGDDGAVGGTDDGLGQQGCAACGPTGHVTAGAALTAVTAGQIVCGTAQEFPALSLPTADQATRDANQEQLLLRMIWHLNLAGFTAGRQRNPSAVISGDKLTVSVAGVYRAYDVFVGVNYDVGLPTVMNQVFPADYVAEAGTAD